MPVVLTLLEGTIVRVTLDTRVMEQMETAAVSFILSQRGWFIQRQMSFALQISMNVPKICRSVIPKAAALTLMAAICVYVMLDSLDQDSTALVSIVCSTQIVIMVFVEQI